MPRHSFPPCGLELRERFGRPVGGEPETGPKAAAERPRELAGNRRVRRAEKRPRVATGDERVAGAGYTSASP
jgi:hypothetical protein